MVQQPVFLRLLFDLLGAYADSADVVKQVTVVCIRLSAQEDASALLANEGMPYFMRTAAGLGMRDTSILALLFELLFYLAFAKENIMFIVQVGDFLGIASFSRNQMPMLRFRQFLCLLLLLRCIGSRATFFLFLPLRTLSS